MSKTPEIIYDAYREANMQAAGQPLKDVQKTEALTLLNRIVSGAYGYEVGEQMYDWPLGQVGIAPEDQAWWGENEWNWPPANVRLIAASEEPQHVRILPQPSDGARIMLIDPNNMLAAAPVTLDANGRTIEGQRTLTFNIDGTSTMWIYRAELGDWVKLSVLTGADDEEFPFPTEFDDYFVIMLAARLNPRYGRALSDESSAMLSRTLDKLKARYAQEVATVGDPGVGIMTAGYDSQWRTGYNRLPIYRLRRHIRSPFYRG